MAMTPSGATITVTMICAPHITPCSSVIGADTLSAFRSTCLDGMKDPSDPRKASISCFRQAYHITQPAVIISAATVPKAAPSTPSPAPGIVTVISGKISSRVGKIRKKLKITSSTHIITFSAPGTSMLPAARIVAHPR